MCDRHLKAADGALLVVVTTGRRIGGRDHRDEQVGRVTTGCATLILAFRDWGERREKADRALHQVVAASAERRKSVTTGRMNRFLGKMIFNPCQRR